MKSYFFKTVTRKCLFGISFCVLMLTASNKLHSQAYNWHFNSNIGQIMSVNNDNYPGGEDFVWLVGQSGWTDGDNTEKMRLTNNGLFVKHNINLMTGSTWDHMIFTHDGGAGYIKAGGAEHGLALQVGTGGSGSLNQQTYNEVMRLMPDGKVGIGTASPSYKLVVSNGTQAFSVNPFGGGIDIHSTGTLAPHYQTDFSIFKGNPGSGILKFKINSAGNVGIGITDPRALLDVGGNIYSHANHFMSPVTGAGGEGEFIQNSKQTSSDHYGLSFYTNSAPRMRIALNGNVGIGTPNPDKGVLHVKGSFHVESDSFQVFHVSAGKALVFVGKTAYEKYTHAQSNGQINQNHFSLWVSDGIVSEDYVVANVSEWSDYVFDKNHALPSLKQIESFIQQHKHLPAIPSEAEVKKSGYSQHKLNNGFLKTMEELTLYAIDQEKKIKELQDQYAQLAQVVEQLKKQVAELKK